MPAIALLVKESLSWLIKVVTTPRNIEYGLTIKKVLHKRWIKYNINKQNITVI